MARLDDLDMPKLAVATLLGIIGFGVGILTWLSMPPSTSWMVQGLVLLFVVACVMPAVAVWFHSKAGLGASVVLALGCVIGLQVLLRGPQMPPKQQEITDITDTLPVAGQQHVSLNCPDGAVVRPLMGPGGLRLVFHNANQREFFMIGQIQRGNILHMMHITPEQQVKLHACTDGNGRGLLAHYVVRKLP